MVDLQVFMPKLGETVAPDMVKPQARTPQALACCASIRLKWLDNLALGWL